MSCAEGAVRWQECGYRPSGIEYFASPDGRPDQVVLYCKSVVLPKRCALECAVGGRELHIENDHKWRLRCLGVLG